MLCLLLRLYFNVPTRLNEEFTAWLLSSMSFATKVEVLGKITRSSAPGSTMKFVISWLKNLNNWRNEVAHAEVTLDIRPHQAIGEAIDNWKWASTRWTRSGPKSEVTTVERLEHWLQSANFAGVILLTIASEMARIPDRVVPQHKDWRLAYNESLNEQGIPTISTELFDYFEIRPEPST